MSTRRTWAVVGGVTATLVAFNLLLHGVGRYTREPSGPRSSSYATAAHGLAAYAELLARAGHDVTQLRDTPARARLDPDTAVVVLDARGVGEEDADALAAFLAAGGRLVAGGAPPGSWLRGVVAPVPEWAPSGRRLTRVRGFAGVADVETAGAGSWRGRSPLVVARALGAGRALLLADSSPLQNRLLARADNAALGLALAGERPVVFVESLHGYGRATGIDAIPARWWWVLGGLALAAGVLMLARGRRLGPPQASARELAPPRREYVDALAALLARTNDPPRALAAVEAEIRRRDPAAQLGPLRSRDDVLAAGRTLARIVRRKEIGG